MRNPTYTNRSRHKISRRNLACEAVDVCFQGKEMVDAHKNATHVAGFAPDRMLNSVKTEE